jgi:hypothetical protein
MVLQMKIAHQKKISRLKYIDGLIPSVIVAYPVNIFHLPVKCRRTIALGNFVGECVKYRHNIFVYKFVGDCGICTKLLWNADGNTPSVNSSVRLAFPALCIVFDVT